MIIMLQIFAIILFSNSLILLLLLSQFSAIILIILKLKELSFVILQHERTFYIKLHLNLKLNIDMMLTHAHQLLNRDNQRLATWCYLLDQNSRWRLVHVHYWLEGRAGPAHSSGRAACVANYYIAFMLATILELCFLLTLCYYSLNYSRISLTLPQFTAVHRYGYHMILLLLPTAHSTTIPPLRHLF